MKDECQQLMIHDLNDQGQGVARTPDGQVVFVPRTVPGDQYEAELIPLTKKILTVQNGRLLKPSEKRRRSFCPAFAKGCGGCHVQELEYAELVQIKAKQIREKMIRLAEIDSADVPIKPLLSMEHPFYYRNHVQLKIQYCRQTDSFERGFFAEQSHQIIAHEPCYISQNSDRAVWQGICDTLRDSSELRVELADTWTECVIRSGERTGEVMLGLVINQPSALKKLAQQSDPVQQLAAAIQARLTDSAESQELKDEIADDRSAAKKLVSIWLLDQTNPHHDRLIYGQERLGEIILGKRFEIGPRSFFQVNTEQAETMYQHIADLLSPQKIGTLYDLYCGTGAIGLCLSDAAENICGVDSWQGSIDNARHNAEINQVTQARFERGKAEDWIGTQEICAEDVLVVDPPRRGLERKLIDALNQTQAERLVYVSCHPGTLARDLKLLAPSWRVEVIQPVDLFPWTMHVETVVLMSRVDK